MLSQTDTQKLTLNGVESNINSYLAAKDSQKNREISARMLLDISKQATAAENPRIFLQALVHFLQAVSNPLEYKNDLEKLRDKTRGNKLLKGIVNSLISALDMPEAKKSIFSNPSDSDEAQRICSYLKQNFSDITVYESKGKEIDLEATDSIDHLYQLMRIIVSKEHDTLATKEKIKYAALIYIKLADLNAKNDKASAQDYDNLRQDIDAIMRKLETDEDIGSKALNDKLNFNDRRKYPLIGELIALFDDLGQKMDNASNNQELPRTSTQSNILATSSKTAILATAKDRLIEHKSTKENYKETYEQNYKYGLKTAYDAWEAPEKGAKDYAARETEAIAFENPNHYNVAYQGHYSGFMNNIDVKFVDEPLVATIEHNG